MTKKKKNKTMGVIEVLAGTASVLIGIGLTFTLILAIIGIPMIIIGAMGIQKGLKEF